MKNNLKNVLACFASASLLVLFAACAPRSTDTYKHLNDMFSAHYSEIVLTVTNTFDEDTSLTSVYTFSYPSAENVVIHYTVESFGEVSLDGGTEKVTRTGTALITDGELILSTGDDIGIPESFAKKGLTFRADCFENAELTNTSFSADVTDVALFLGSPLSCSGMKVSAAFGSAFESLTVSFAAADGSAVEFCYEFTL